MAFESIDKGRSKYEKQMNRNNHVLDESQIINKYILKFESTISSGEFYRDADGNWKLKPVKSGRKGSRRKRTIYLAAMKNPQ